MNLLFLQRSPSTEKFTRGELSYNGRWLCHTLEDVVREVPGLPVSDWKIKGRTAIPAGKYRVTLEFSNRFGPDTITIHGVEGYDYIRCHGGNTELDTEGCPLFGLNETDTGIRNCAPAVNAVKDLIRAAGGEVWIEIVNGGLES